MLPERHPICSSRSRGRLNFLDVSLFRHCRGPAPGVCRPHASPVRRHPPSPLRAPRIARETGRPDPAASDQSRALPWGARPSRPLARPCGRRRCLTPDVAPPTGPTRSSDRRREDEAYAGELLGWMPDGYLQRARVGALYALAADYLARADSVEVGLIGSGWQARGANSWIALRAKH